MALLLFGTISLVWGIFGIALTVAPRLWQSSIARVLEDPSRRFIVTHGILLAGLMMSVGTSSWRGYWLWMILGLIAVVKAMVLLGSSHNFRERLREWSEMMPLWLCRLWGVCTLTLVTLFVTDLITSLR